MWPLDFPTFSTVWTTASLQANVPFFPAIHLRRLRPRVTFASIGEIHAEAVRMPVSRFNLPGGHMDFENADERILEGNLVAVRRQLPLTGSNT